MSIDADQYLPMTHEGGTADRCRLRRVWGAALVAVALAACTPMQQAEREATQSPTTPSAEPTTDPAAEAACQTLWGDPDYTQPLSRDVLDRAATAPSSGPGDPLFYSMTGDDVERAFEQAPDDLQESAGAVATWLREEPAEGADADLDALRDAWTDLATACAPLSAAALWQSGSGEDGTKPAALVCADVYDTPQTFTHFANANVLTSNMFKLVGRVPQTVPSDRMEDVSATREYLDQEIAAVDDQDVAAALEEIRAPFTAAEDGDLDSPGLQEPLDRLGTACSAVGYYVPGVDDDSEGGLA
jgi:hypothetical protein